jgi:hypothetical protein
MKRGGRRIRWIAVLALLMLGAGSAAAAAVSSTQGPGHRGFSAPKYGVLKPSRTVDVRSLPRVHQGRISIPHPQAPSPALLARRAGRTLSSQRGPLQGRVGTKLVRPHAAPLRPGRLVPNRPAPDRAGRGSKSKSAAAGSFETLNSFTGATLNNTGCCEPPDTQIAVSPNRELEAVNLTGFVYDRGGTQLGSFDLTSLLGGGATDNGSDPQVVYDAGSGRWFITLMVCQGAGCGGNWTTMGVDIAVSNGSDPLGSWTVYQNIYSGTPFFDQGNLQDQPKLGFSDDKVTISDNVYTGHCGAGSCFKGEDVTTYQKSDLIAGITAHYVGFTSGYAFDSIPARPTPFAAGTNSTQYLVWQGFGSLGINQITGTPNGGNVSNSNQQSPAIGGMTGTVNAAGVPAGAQSDNYIRSATWEGSHLWTSTTDGCNIGGTVYDCTRLDEVNTSNPAALSVLLDQNVGDSGTYEIYPSVTQDCLGEVVFGITFSDNSGTLPSAQAVGSQTPGASVYARNGYRFGDTAYSGGRWGDYSGVQEDPADCGNVWTAQEYGAVGNSGNWATAMGQFSFDSPAIFSTSPSSGPATGGTTVAIFGVDFVNGGTSVSFGATAASVTFIDSGHLQATSPAGSGGPVSISVTTANGTSTNGQFSWVPAVSGVSPNQGPTAGGNAVDITGAGFTGASSVSFGGSTASFTVNNDGDITASAPSASAGTVDVTVTTGTGTSATSSSDLYTYDAPPTVSGVVPHAGPTSGANTVTINGTNFVSGATVRFGSTAGTAVTFVSASKLTAKAPAHATGVVDVTVLTPGGTSPTSAADHYTYDARPTVTSVVPTVGATAGGNTVTINGTNFLSGATVQFGTTVATGVTLVSATKLTAKAPAHAAGVVDVRVTTPGGTSAIAAGDHYTYDAPPTVSSVVPNAGTTTGGNTVTINGTNFVSGATVKFGATAGTAVTLVSATKLTAKAPAHAAGVVDVTVHTVGGTSAISAGDKYAYGSPAVSSVVPNAGPTAGGNTVTINGSNFVPGATVKFASTAGTGVTFVSATKLTAKAPAHAASVVDVTVTTPRGPSATSAADKYAYGPPKVSSVVPKAGPTAGGNTVTINGSNFVSGATVRFGATAGTAVTFVSATKLTAKAPAHAVGVVDVTVHTAGGTSAISAADQYTYDAPPTVASFTPTSGVTGSTVTINGTNFVPGATVKFGTIASRTVTFVSAVKIKAVVPNGAAPGKVSVSTPGGTATSAANFTPTLSIIGFSPTSGPTGTVVTISGRGFNASSTIRFHGTLASHVTHVSSTQVKATVPASATTGTITVTNTTAPAGTATSATSYTKT